MKYPRFATDAASLSVWHVACAYGWRPSRPRVEMRAWSAPIAVTHAALLGAAPMPDLAEMLGRDELAQSDAAFRALVTSW